MFNFTRGTTDYEIKYVNQGDDDLLVCEYKDGALNRWRSVLDTFELVNINGGHYDDEDSFLDAFLVNLNKSLDKAHGDGDSTSPNPQVRLTALIAKLTFDGKHVIRG